MTPAPIPTPSLKSVLDSRVLPLPIHLHLPLPQLRVLQAHDDSMERDSHVNLNSFVGGVGAICLLLLLLLLLLLIWRLWCNQQVCVARAERGFCGWVGLTYVFLGRLEEGMVRAHNT